MGRHQGIQELRYRLATDDGEPMAIGAAVDVGDEPGPPPAEAVAVELLDRGPYGRRARVQVDGRPRSIELSVGPSPAERRVQEALVPLALAADVALMPIYVLVGVPFAVALLIVS